MSYDHANRAAAAGVIRGGYDRMVKIFTRYQGASRNGGLKALRGAGFL